MERRELSMKRMLIMFSVCKLDAADLCICCYHLALMDAPGADWRLYAYAPDRHASIYQARLDAVLPPAGPSYHVDTPIWSKAGGEAYEIDPDSVFVATTPARI